MDPRFKRTQAALRHALFTQLKTTAITEVTVAALCRTAGINRRTFYLHYDNVWELFVEYEEELSQRLKSTLRATDGTPVNLVATFNQFFLGNLAGFTYICRYRRQDRLLQDMGTMLTGALLAARRHEPTVTQMISAQYIASGVINVYVEWLNATNSIPFSQLTVIVQGLIAHDFELLIT